MAEELKCWAVADKSSGEGDSSFRIICDKNNTDENQTAVFEVVSEDGNIIKEIYVKQEPREVFVSAQMQKMFTRDNCAANEKGGDILYIVPAGKYKSYISQEDADAKAEQDLIVNGQRKANEEGTCTVYIWYNKRVTATFTKNDCDGDAIGSSVEYIVNAGKYSSEISQEDADQKAADDIALNGQKYANEHGSCSTTYKSKMVSGDFTRDNCPQGYIGTTVKYIVEAGKYTSKISQADADAKAEKDLAEKGQSFANQYGTCTQVYYNDRKSGTFQKNDCSSGTGSFVEFVVEAGTISSKESKIDANKKAEDKVKAEGQAYANEHGTCSSSFYNKKIEVTLKKDDCVEGEGKENTYVVEAGKYSSEVSQEDADRQAQEDADANAQKWVNENTDCIITYLSSEKKKTFTKNDCNSEQKGSDVEYKVDAGKYTSIISQEDADRQAQEDIDTNGQAYANEHGICIDPYKNVRKVANISKNDCPAGENGSSVEYVVEAGKYSSFESQAAADALADAEIAEKGQAYANEHGECLDMFVSIAMSKEFQKTDCGEGLVGSKVAYRVEAGKYASEISQEDADRQAIEDLEENGPSYANKNGICLYGNDYASKEFFKECPAGQKGSPVLYEVPENTFTSSESKDAANALAQADIEEKGQAYANTHGTCQDLFVNKELSGEFQKDDCDGGMVGSKVVYKVEAGKHSSDVSQEDADAKAQKDLDDNGQAYANKNGTCLYGNDRKSGKFTKECPTGEQGTEVEYVVEANTYTSSESKEAANALADADIAEKGQEYANNNGECLTIYYNARKSKKFKRNNCASGQSGSEVEYVVEAKKHQSVISQADADAKADKDIADNGQKYANDNGTCLYLSVQKSGTYYKSDCGSCKHGVAYSYVVEAGKYTSEISQADADNKAQKDVADNGQAAANKNGTCANDSTTPTWTDTGTTQCNGCTSQKQQKDTNPCSSSYNTTKYINGGSRDCSKNGSWGSWSYGSCNGCTQSGTRTNTCGGTESTSRDCSSWDYYGTGDCVGHTRYDAYKNSCTGSIDRTYSVDCYDCCNCGSYGSWSKTSQCSGTGRVYERYDDCGNRDTKVEYIDGECGHCTSTWRDTGNTRCQNGTSQKEQEDSCNSSNKKWVNGGTACTATNSNRYCKSGCTCETCVEAGTVSASGSTTSSAQSSANSQAQSKANSMSCKSTVSSKDVWQNVTRNNCGSGCTGSSVSVHYPDGVGTGCSQSEANANALSAWSSQAQAYANANGTCNCPPVDDKVWNAGPSARYQSSSSIGYSIVYDNQCDNPMTSRLFVSYTDTNQSAQEVTIVVSIPTGSGTFSGTLPPKSPGTINSRTQFSAYLSPDGGKCR